MMAPNIWDGDLGQYRCEDGGILKLMAEEVAACNHKNGWYDSARTFGEEIALLHSECSEALEAYRTHGIRRVVADPATFPYSEIVEIPIGEDYPRYHDRDRDIMLPLKPEGVPSELADVLVRLLDTCKRHGVDLFAEYRAKMDYNWQRSYRHGGKAL